MNIEQIAEMYELRVIQTEIGRDSFRIIKGTNPVSISPMNMTEKEMVAFFLGVEFGGNQMGVFMSNQPSTN